MRKAVRRAVRDSKARGGAFGLQQSNCDAGTLGRRMSVAVDSLSSAWHSCALIATAAGIESSPKDAARSIAADAIVCLEIQRPDRVIDRFIDPRFQDYLKLFPQYKKLLGDPKLGELRKVVDVIAGQLDTTWDQALRALTGGGILAALEADPGKEPRLYLLITPRDNDLLERANQVLLKLARQDAKDKGKPEPVKTSEHRGVIVHALGGETKVAYGLVAGRLAISNSVKNLERLIDRSPLLASQAGGAADKAKGPLASLADQADWKAIKAKQDSDSLAWGIAHLDRLRQLDPKRFTLPDKPNNGVTFLFGSWYQALKRAPCAPGQHSLVQTPSWRDDRARRIGRRPRRPSKAMCPSQGRGPHRSSSRRARSRRLASGATWRHSGNRAPTCSPRNSSGLRPA